MNGPGLFTRAITAFLAALPPFVSGVLVGRARWLYQAGFSRVDLSPPLGSIGPARFDPLGLGPLQRTMTANLAAGAGPATSLVPAPATGPGGAIRLRLSRPASVTSGLLGFGAIVYPLPSEYRILRISATFSFPEGPHGAGDGWAVVVHAGEGTVPDRSTKDRLIAVTLQSAFNTEAAPDRPGARMNTVDGAAPGMPYVGGAGAGPWLPSEVYDALFPSGFATTRTDDGPTGTGNDPPQPPHPVFTLEADLYRGAQIGYARLYVHAWNDTVLATPGPGYPVGYLESRPFIHPMLDAEKPIEAAGFLIAIAQGDGPASVTVHDLRVYGLTGRDYMIWLLSKARGGAGLAGVLRRAGRVLVDHAFGRLAEPRLL